jgi:ribosomal protein L37E
MSIGGLVARGVLLKEQMKKKPCKRCGLHYDHKEMDECPHCGHLDQTGLEKLLAEKEEEHQGNRTLGSVFLVAAVVLAILMVIIAGA